MNLKPIKDRLTDGVEVVQYLLDSLHEGEDEENLEELLRVADKLANLSDLAFVAVEVSR